MPANESLELIQRLEAEVGADQPRLRTYLAALREQIEADQLAGQETQQRLAEFREAYEKLTQPANRVATFLAWTDDPSGTAKIMLGETEYVVRVDPHLGREQLTLGVRVLLNEAYAIVGTSELLIPGPVVKVSQVADETTLRVGPETPGSPVLTVLRSAALKATKIEPGDEVALDPTGKVALRHFENPGARDYFVDDVPETPWSAVGGQQEAIRLIRETIEQPLLYPEIYEKFGKKPIKGVLLYGPPGCGKTLIGKATAHNITREYSRIKGKATKEYFMSISGPKILNMWVGETERMVREIFETARARAADGHLVFIFMDEAEAILRTRSTGRYFNMSNTVVPQFCAELDGLVSLENVVLMLTSNRPDTIDPAVLRPGRIDRRVKVHRPDADAAKQIIGLYLTENLPLDPALMEEHDHQSECARKALIEKLTLSIFEKSPANELASLALRNGTRRTLYTFDFVSGAILASIIDRAKESAIRRAIADRKVSHGISWEDLDEARRAEFRESEIFPKSDALEDWLQLLDFNSDQVVSIRPKGGQTDESYRRTSVV